MRFIIAVACCLAASPAAASGGLSCSAEDGNAVINIDGGVTRGMGGGLFTFGADVEIKDRRVRSELRHTHFEREHVPQYWLDTETLMLGLYRETEGDEPHAFVQLVVKTLFDGNVEEYQGDYAIMIYDTGTASNGEAQVVEFTGTIACFAE